MVLLLMEKMLQWVQVFQAIQEGDFVLRLDFYQIDYSDTMEVDG